MQNLPITMEICEKYWVKISVCFAKTSCCLVNKNTYDWKFAFFLQKVCQIIFLYPSLVWVCQHNNDAFLINQYSLHKTIQHLQNKKDKKKYKLFLCIFEKIQSLNLIFWFFLTQIIKLNFCAILESLMRFLFLFSMKKKLLIFLFRFKKSAGLVVISERKTRIFITIYWERFIRILFNHYAYVYFMQSILSHPVLRMKRSLLW